MPQGPAAGPEHLKASFAARVDQVDSTYDQHSDVIDAACSAFSSMASTALEGQSPADMLSAAKRIVGALDLIQQLHPYVGVAVLALRAVLSLEMKRQENDQRVAALVVQACSMMFDLLQLRDVGDLEVAGPNGQVFQGRLQHALSDAAKQLKDCGNAIDRYYKSKKISRYFKASQWEEVFVSYATEFARLRGDIQASLAIRTSLLLDDGLSRVVQVDLKLEAVLTLLRKRSRLEEYVSQAMALHGGFEVCLKGGNVLREIAAATYRQLNAYRSTGSSAPGPDLASLLSDLRTPLEIQLQENRAIFDVVLETVSADLAQLQDTVAAAEERIVRAFTSGPHKRVKDPHLRFVWKTMNWKFTVRAKDFLPTIHDYFADGLRQSMTARRRAYIAEYSVRPSSPDSSRMASSADNESIYAYDEERPPPLSPADEWCLQYLNVTSFPALKEVFDNDVNGMISIGEVNSFCNGSLPREWNILQKLAYGAAGHHIELVRYGNQIRALLHEMSDLSLEVRPENRGLVAQYLDSQEILRTKAMVSGIRGYERRIDVDLDKLISERMSGHQLRLHKRLESIRYEIPSPDLIGLLLDKGRVEQIIAPIIHVLLLRHTSIVRLAKRVILDRRELEAASSSLSSVFGLAKLRIRRLTESFREQGLNTSQRLETFSHGLFAYLCQPDSGGPHHDYRFFMDRRESTDIILEDINVLSLRFPCPDPAQQAYGVPGRVVGPSTRSLGPRARFQSAVTLVVDQVRRSRWSYLALRRSQMRQYLLLAPRAILQSFSSPDGPPYLIWPQTTILQQLRDYLSPQDLAYCDAVSDLGLRKSTAIHKGVRCNGCLGMPVINNRYDCLECAEVQYTLCQNCVSIEHEHHRNAHSQHIANHNMILHTREVSEDWRGRIRQRALEQLHLSIPKSHTKNSEVQFGIEGILLCDECASEMPGDFHCCIECPMIGSACCLCAACVARKKFKAARSHDRDHWMVLVRDRGAPSVTGIFPIPSQQAQSPSPPSLQAVNERIDEVNTRLDALNSRVDRITQMLEILLQRES